MTAELESLFEDGYESLDKQASRQVFLDNFCDEIMEDNNRVLGSYFSKTTIHNSDRVDTEDNHEIKDVGSEKADSHCRAKVDSNCNG